MSRLRDYLAFFFIGLLLAIFSFALKAQPEGEDTIESAPVTATTTTTTTSLVTTVHPTIVTPVPVAKDVTPIPVGYYACAQVEGSWYHDIWIPAHRICAYDMSPDKAYIQGPAWVEGYWACAKFTTDGACIDWDWRAGHWEKAITFY